MEPQYFRPKRWVRILQTAIGAIVVMMGSNALFSPSGAVIGVAALAIGLFTLGQGVYAAVIATEDNLQIRRNIWKPVVTPWEEVDYCMPGNPLAIRLLSGKVVRMVPLLDDSAELRSMIDDTVGPPP